MPAVNEDDREEGLLLAYEAAQLHGESVDIDVLSTRCIFVEAVSAWRPLCGYLFPVLIATGIYVTTFLSGPSSVSVPVH